MQTKQPSGFWVSVEGTHFGHVHVPAFRAAKAIDDLMKIEDNGQNHRVTILVSEYTE